MSISKNARRENSVVGRPTLYQQSTPWILNFPTKDEWRANSKIEYLEKGLEYFVANYKKAGITSIAFPKLGAQNGKLAWDEVGPLMAKYLSQVDIDVYIYIADGDREYQSEMQADNTVQVAAWKCFSDLALSLDRLQQEVGLSRREAKKVFERRQTTEFTSPADINAIVGLAKISSQRITKYTSRQQYAATALPGITEVEQPVQQKERIKESAPKRKQKNAKQKIEQPDQSLFTTHVLTS
jgi:hypothetical protein